MNDIYLAELKDVIELHLRSDRERHKGSILILLKELARRLLLWKREIEKKGIPVSNKILFDVAFVITGKRIDKSPIDQLFPRTDELILSNYDHLFFRFYLNWLIHKNDIERLGFNLLAPYDPYLEIVKRGGSCFKYQQNRIEVYPYIGIEVYPLEDYMKVVPFYKDEMDLDLADKKYKNTAKL